MEPKPVMNYSDPSKNQSGELEEFALRLSRLRPAALDDSLAHRLEMALHRAEEERSTPDNIIHFPFVRWTAAAAALVVAMGLAVESTVNTGRPATVAVQQSQPLTEGDVRPVYQMVNGRMVQSSNQQVMERASYKGIRVINGKAYRHYQHGESAYWEPALDAVGK
jgi:hypothetical protein